MAPVRSMTENGHVTTAAQKSDTPARRDEILRIAAELFARDGFHAVGMRAIADAVGIRSSSLYYHFPSKMDILHAIARDATAAFVDSQLPRFQVEGSRGERLEELFREHVIYFHEHRVEEAVGLRELRELEEPRRAEINAIRRSYQHELMAVIDEGVRAGEFDVDDAHIAAMAILNMINGVNEWFRDGGKLTIEDVAQEYAHIAVHRILGAKRGRKRLAAKPARAKPAAKTAAAKPAGTRGAPRKAAAKSRAKPR
jgi:AcrR family transcriptional regulator